MNVQELIDHLRTLNPNDIIDVVTFPDGEIYTVKSIESLEPGTTSLYIEQGA